MTGRRCIVAAIFLASCARAAAPPQTGPDAEARREVEALAQELREADDRLDDRLAADRCEDACPLGARVCELADRLCAISERHPGDAPLAERCRDGRERCRSAGERLAARCACAPP